MRANTLRILCFYLCFAAVQSVCAQTASPPPPPLPPGSATGPGSTRPGTPRAPGSRQQRDGSKDQRGDRRNPEASRQAGALGQDKAGQPRNALQLGPAGRWWDNKSVVSSVGINPKQQKKMDSIFNANRPAIVNSYKAFLKAQQNLETANKAAHPDQTQVFAAIDAVNQARSDLQKATSAMLLQIRSEMSPEQVEKLEKLP